MAKLDQALIKGTTYEIVPEIAPLFSENTAYAVDDCVIKDAVLYRFTVAHAAGPWIGTDAEEITVGKELTGLKADLVEKFSENRKYEIGDIVLYNGKYYEFMSTHSPGAFTLGEVNSLGTSPLIDYAMGYANYALTGVQSGISEITNWEYGEFLFSPVSLTYNTRRVRPNAFIKVYAGDTVTIYSNGYGSRIGIWQGTLESNTAVVKEYGYRTDDRTYSIDKDGFFCVVFANASDLSIDVPLDTFTGKVTVTTYASRKIDEIKYNDRHETITSIDGWEIGTFSVHKPVASDVRIRNLNIYLVEPGSTIESTGNIQFKVIFYDALGRYQTETGWRTGTYTITGSPTPYVRFFLRHDDESATSLDDLEKIRLNLVVKKTPSLKIHVVAQYSIGDAMILKTSDKKAILIDIGRYQDYGRLKSALISEGITKIDYVIISHYHADHINTTSLTNLISDFDLTECKFILPPTIPTSYVDPDGHADDLRTNESGVISLLNTNNILYINEYDCDMWHMWLCGIEFDFYNMDHSSWYSQNADYNQMSIVCVANVGNNTVFFTGDMGNPLETKLLPIFNRTVTIAKFGHHGLNTNPNLDFWHKIKPELLFATTPEVWHDEMIANSQQIRFANYNGIKYISAHVSGGKIIINVDPDSYSTDGYNYMLDNLSSEEYFNYVL